MKTQILTIALLLSSIYTYGQTRNKENYRCVMVKSINGEVTRIDTTFKTKAEYDAFMKLQKVSVKTNPKLSGDSSKHRRVVIKTISKEGNEKIDSTLNIDEEVFEIIEEYVPEGVLKGKDGKVIDIQKIVEEELQKDSNGQTVKSIRHIEIIRMEIRVEEPDSLEWNKLIQIHNQELTRKRDHIKATREKIAVKLYPNPSKGAVKVKLQDLTQDAVVSLLDVSGKKIQQRKVSTREGNLEVGFDLSRLAKGVYFVKVVTGKNANIQKLILK